MCDVRNIGDIGRQHLIDEHNKPKGCGASGANAEGPIERRREHLFVDFLSAEGIS
jgi:hypothetical protein